MDLRVIVMKRDDSTLIWSHEVEPHHQMQFSSPSLYNTIELFEISVEQLSIDLSFSLITLNEWTIPFKFVPMTPCSSCKYYFEH